MNKRFANIVESLEPSFTKLLEMEPVTPLFLPSMMPKAGIYLLSEAEQHLYVGRSRDIRRRIRFHSRPGATYKMAAFAFRLAREATGNLAATYKKKGSRADLMGIPEFRDAFDTAKERIRGMNLRYVEEIDPVRQAVLEIYVAVSLQTPYNSFETH